MCRSSRHEKVSDVYLVLDIGDVALLPPVHISWQIFDGDSGYKWLTGQLGSIRAGTVTIVHSGKFT